MIMKDHKILLKKVHMHLNNIRKEHILLWRQTERQKKLLDKS